MKKPNFPPLNLTSLQTRLLSGFTIGPVVILMVLMGGVAFLALIGICTFIAAYEWVKLARNVKHSVLSTIFGLLYIGFGFWCGYILRETYGVSTAVLFIGMIWFSDIGAYFVGKRFGGPKLAKTVSPNKTWSGFAGAALSPALFFVLWMAGHNLFLGSPGLSAPLLGGVFAVGCLIGATGQAGDLLVSWFKRRAAIKDTGDIIPGHGGLLDRVDSILLAAPVFLYFVSKFWDILP